MSKTTQDNATVTIECNRRTDTYLVLAQHSPARRKTRHNLDTIRV